MVTHGYTCCNDQRRSPKSTSNILALTVYVAHDEQKQATHNPCALQRATIDQHTSQRRHNTVERRLKTERRPPEWQAWENVVVVVVGRQIVRACSGRRAGRRGNATDNAVTRYMASNYGRESAARSWFPWKQWHHCTCTTATSQHLKLPPPPTGTPVGSIGSTELYTCVEFSDRFT